MKPLSTTTRTGLRLMCAFAACTLFAACSVPNLEKPQCTEARSVVKRFYSFHFGNDMRMSTENLNARQAYLSPELFRMLSATGESTFDYFTDTEQYPKAFRVGTCSSDSADRADLQVVLLWRDDSRSEQTEVRATAIKAGGEWRIDKVSK